jgi:hypothetical protein
MKWDEWRGSMDGRPTLWVKHLLCGFGYHVDLHKMVAADDDECFHSHPATAIRLILWGGYAEETDQHIIKTWKPGRVGLIRPEFSHRIAWLRNARVSYSLWIRFRKCAKVKLTGDGWAKQAPLYLDPGCEIQGR